jgi:hypothetical protein
LSLSKLLAEFVSFTTCKFRIHRKQHFLMTRASGPDSRVRKSVKPFEGAELPRVNKGKRNPRVEKAKATKLKPQKAKSAPKGTSKRAPLHVISSSDELDGINPLLSM